MSIYSEWRITQVRTETSQRHGETDVDMLPSELPEIREGSELWYRQSFMFPLGFGRHKSEYTSLKLIQVVRSRSSDESRYGSIDLMVDSMGQLVSPVYDGLPDATFRAHPAWVTINEWFTVEKYIKFGRDNPVQKLWLNGSLVDSWGAALIAQSDPELYISGVSLSDQAQKSVNNPVYAGRGVTSNYGVIDNTVHMARDDNGFPFIGKEI